MADGDVRARAFVIVLVLLFVFGFFLVHVAEARRSVAPSANLKHDTEGQVPSLGRILRAFARGGHGGGHGFRRSGCHGLSDHDRDDSESAAGCHHICNAANQTLRWHLPFPVDICYNSFWVAISPLWTSVVRTEIIDLKGDQTCAGGAGIINSY